MEEFSEKDILFHLRELSEKASHESFRVIYDHYYHKLFKQAMFYFDHPAIAQEIVADVFVSLWQNHKVLHRVENPDAYLFISLKHAQAKYVRKNYRNNPELLTDNLPEPTASNSSEELLLSKELDNKYREALTKLPPRCAEVFRLIREEKKKYAEVAEMLGISTKTVDNQMNKAIKILYAELKEYIYFTFF